MARLSNNGRLCKRLAGLAFVLVLFCGVDGVDEEFDVHSLYFFEVDGWSCHGAVCKDGKTFVAKKE
jgi:hypothetical protein